MNKSILQWQDIDKTKFVVFIRDLSESLQINLKHLLEDSFKEKDKKSLKPLKKKDFIILEQTKKRYQKDIATDKQKINYFLQEIDDTHLYDPLCKLKTNEGKEYYKCELLTKLWKQKRKYKKDIMNLYFQLYDQELSEDTQLIITKIHKTLQGGDYKLYILEQLGDLLPPLNFWDKRSLQLDEWQKHIISYIKHKQSVLVKAPTSSGKTFLSMSAGIFHKKILYVCPSKPVVYQVGSHFIKMGYKVHYCVETSCDYSYDSSTNIFIGTPKIIEDFIYKIGITFDYAVYDEIHNIDNIDYGHMYENILKLVTCPFIMLSATICNIETLKTYLEEIHKEKTIHLVEYKERFINQQRWIWDSNEIHTLHPLACINEMNEELLTNQLSFTPNDSARLFSYMEEVFEDTNYECMIDEISPDNYFKKEGILTLNDSKEYEMILKKTLCKLQDQGKVNTILKHFEYKQEDKRTDIFEVNDLYLFLQKSKQQDLLPMICFHTDKDVITNTFNELYKLLLQKETDYYPFHYKILEKKQELYLQYLDHRKAYESNLKIKKSVDSYNEKNAKMDQFDKSQKDIYCREINNYYEKCIQSCKGNVDQVKDITQKQISNLQKELSIFLKYPDFQYQDIYKKHHEFCFTNQEPMSGEDIKKIRKELNTTLQTKISYEHPIFQMLKRGIGIYLDTMPDEYNWIIQKCMSQKLLGIVFSDRTLCLGIDLPIRSVTLLGYSNPSYTTSDYLQMSGRAGRRGHDTQGNILFYQVTNYKELMKGELPSMKGNSSIIPDNYSVLYQLNKNIPEIDIQRVYDISLNKETFHSIYQVKDYYKLNKIVWKLRYYNYSPDMLSTIERHLFMKSETDRKDELFDTLLLSFTINSDTKQEYKQKKIMSNEICKDIYIIGEIVRLFYNYLHPIDYLITRRVSHELFVDIRKLVISYRGF